MYAAEKKGEIKKGTAKRWAKHTKSTKKLPNKVKKSGLKKFMKRTYKVKGRG
jgi:hypothetical protein